MKDLLEKHHFIEKKSIEAKDSPENVKIMLFELK
jgi:hypothetical protein